jgi:Ca2+-binding RTX toxin-like protein
VGLALTSSSARRAVTLSPGGDGNDTALMGAGDDVFTWNPGDDNDVLEGQAGIDRMDFNGNGSAEGFTISPNGGRVLFFRDVARWRWT